jgi:indolepyruvate ferredoxin oxidoreductase alpha subunit
MNDGKSQHATSFLLGNEAIARAALEAGIHFASGYPGTPSSEIIRTIVPYAEKSNVHVEWSVNEKVACEGAAAAAFAGLRSLAAMKNAGLSVALDFLTHLSMTGLGDNNGSLVVVVCDDPDGHSSGDETDSRWLARFSYAPLLEPSSIPEAKQLMQWAFDLSTEFDCHVMLRSYTRLSHASTMIELGEITQKDVKPQTDSSVSISPYLARPKHAAVLKRLDRIREKFETSPFNIYEGPDQPQLMIVCGGSGYLCARDAVASLGVDQSVGILKLTTLWPFPKKWIADHLARADQFLITEEVDPYIEIHVKETMVDTGHDGKKIFGKESGHIPAYGEITPDRVISALSEILDMEYSGGSEEYDKNIASQADALIIGRGLAWCPGCPHRATFWALEKAVKQDRRNAYVTGGLSWRQISTEPAACHGIRCGSGDRSGATGPLWL